jgi:hypothetical protein
MRPKARLATTLGALLGGFVPVASFVVAHREVGWDAHGILAAVLVLGGLVFSAKTVRQWAALACRDDYKALGFVVLLEGVMVTSHTEWLGYAALAMLVGINAVSTGCTLSLRGDRS